jgi:hypothetical protein
MDGLTAAYLIAFIAGGGFAVLSFVLGSFGGHGGHGHAGNAGGHALGGHASHAALPAHGGETGSHAAVGHGGQAGDAIARACGPLLNFSAMAAFACAGGGAGYLARRMGAGALVSLVAAVPSGLAAGYLIGCLTSWLRRGTRYLKPEPLAGALASVIAPASQEHLGEILYVRGGARGSLPARGTSDRLLEPGTEVVILEVKDGIARVAPAGELLGVDAEARRLDAPREEEKKP